MGKRPRIKKNMETWLQTLHNSDPSHTWVAEHVGSIPQWPEEQFGLLSMVASKAVIKVKMSDIACHILLVLIMSEDSYPFLHNLQLPSAESGIFQIFSGTTTQLWRYSISSPSLTNFDPNLSYEPNFQELFQKKHLNLLRKHLRCRNREISLPA